MNACTNTYGKNIPDHLYHEKLVERHENILKNVKKLYWNPNNNVENCAWQHQFPFSVSDHCLKNTFLRLCMGQKWNSI